MDVRIYQPCKTAMQSKMPKDDRWYLVCDAMDDSYIDPLMGWTGSSDTRTQLKLSFSTKEAAIAYAEQQGFCYTVSERPRRTARPSSYQQNFCTK